MELKVGDRVRIREDLKEDEAYEGIWVTEEMLQYVGKIATIKWSNDRYYRIDLDDEEYAWVKEFFEKIRAITLEDLEQRIEKLEKEVFKPLTIKDGIKKSLEENLKISLKPSLLTEDERAILRNLDKKYDFIARDEDGDLHIFSKKPEKEVDEWNVCGIMNYEIFSMFNDIFQFIKWNDKEPYNIEELLKGECEE